MSNKKTGVKAAILIMSFVQMGTNGIAPALSGIADRFSDSSASTIQYLMTFPSLMVVIFSLIAARLSKKIPKKIIAFIGCLLICIGGLLAVLFHEVLILLFIWEGLIGIGIGFEVPMAVSLVSDCFEGKERASLMGQLTSAANIGSMLMTFAGGILTAIAWSYNYWVYLIAIPGAVSALLLLPSTKSSHSSGSVQKERIEKSVWLYCIIAAGFLFLFNIGPTNLSMHVVQTGIGTAAAAGTAATVFLLGGTVLGLFFGKLDMLFKNLTIPLGCFLLAAGLLILYNSQTSFTLYIGCFVSGASISLVMPKCMLKVSYGKDAATVVTASALIMAFSNLGTFATPLITSITNLITVEGDTKSRFLLSAFLAILLAVIILAVQLNKIIFLHKKNI